ncbi:MAG: hypothetical protein K6B65_06125 [Bacilli bacterium]|nr:hypothetical protein [Bacilli bacterium]
MEDRIKENNLTEESEPRFEQASNGVSFREIALNKEAHKEKDDELTKLKTKRSDDYAMIIVSLILAVIGIIFLLLSFRYNTLKERVFVPSSLPFILSMISLSSGLGLFIWGNIRLLRHIRGIKNFYRLKGTSKDE